MLPPVCTLTGARAVGPSGSRRGSAPKRACPCGRGVRLPTPDLPRPTVPVALQAPGARQAAPTSPLLPADVRGAM